MSAITHALVRYGKKLYDAHLVVGSGGNISARDGDTAWLSPSGLSLGELHIRQLCPVAIDSGKPRTRTYKPTSETQMHLAIYRARPDIHAVFHVHSPWLCGVISSGLDMAQRAMFAEVVNDLGRRATVPYVTPTTQELADRMAEAAKEAESIFMVNHGFCALGTTMRQAFFRCQIVEDAAQSLVAASLVGIPQWLTPEQEDDLMALAGPQHRVKMMER